MTDGSFPDTESVTAYIQKGISDRGYSIIQLGKTNRDSMPDPYSAKGDDAHPTLASDTRPTATLRIIGGYRSDTGKFTPLHSEARHLGNKEPVNQINEAATVFENFRATEFGNIFLQAMPALIGESYDGAPVYLDIFLSSTRLNAGDSLLVLLDRDVSLVGFTPLQRANILHGVPMIQDRLSREHDPAVSLRSGRTPLPLNHAIIIDTKRTVVQQTHLATRDRSNGRFGYMAISASIRQSSICSGNWQRLFAKKGRG